MMLEFESLPTVRALEPPEDGGLLVCQHVTLQTINIRKLFRTIRAGLGKYKWLLVS